jgi:hypothetical protein
MSWKGNDEDPREIQVKFDLTSVVSIGPIQTSYSGLKCGAKSVVLPSETLTTPKKSGSDTPKRY